MTPGCPAGWTRHSSRASVFLLLTSCLRARRQLHTNLFTPQRALLAHVAQKGHEQAFCVLNVGGKQPPGGGGGGRGGRGGGLYLHVKDRACAAVVPAAAAELHAVPYRQLLFSNVAGLVARAAHHNAKCHSTRDRKRG